MTSEFGRNYGRANLKMAIKINGRYVQDIDKATSETMSFKYSILAQPYGITVNANWDKGSTELFIPYENVNFLEK